MSERDDLPTQLAVARPDSAGYHNRSDVASTGIFVSERLHLNGMQRLAPKGYLSVSHCRATYHNLCVLRDASFGRASALIRDPRDATVSWTYHLRNVRELRNL